MLGMIDECAHEARPSRIDPKLNFTDAIGVLTDHRILRAVPDHARSDCGPGFIAMAVQNRDHLCRGEDRLHRELPDSKFFYKPKEAKVIVKSGAGTTTPCADIGRLATSPAARGLHPPIRAASRQIVLTLRTTRQITTMGPTISRQRISVSPVLTRQSAIWFRHPTISGATP